MIFKSQLSIEEVVQVDSTSLAKVLSLKGFLIDSVSYEANLALDITYCSTTIEKHKPCPMFIPDFHGCDSKYYDPYIEVANIGVGVGRKEMQLQNLKSKYTQQTQFKRYTGIFRERTGGVAQERCRHSDSQTKSLYTIHQNTHRMHFTLIMLSLL